MGTFQRGVVKSITFEVEYPDGSKKTAQVDNPQEISSIAFEDATMGEDELKLFHVSDSDWKENPAMVLRLRSGGGGIPFCTHNGCKG